MNETDTIVSVDNSAVKDLLKDVTVSRLAALHLLTDPITKWTSKKPIDFAFLLFRNKDTAGRGCMCKACYNNRLEHNV